MTADITEVGLAELLHLPQVQVRTEQVEPGRQGGPLLVVIGISLIGLALWGWATEALGWSVFALTALGAASTMTGIGLNAHTQPDQQPTDSTPSRRLVPVRGLVLVWQHREANAGPRGRSWTSRRGQSRVAMSSVPIRSEAPLRNPAADGRCDRPVIGPVHGSSGARLLPPLAPPWRSPWSAPSR
jgi:hypothetical protein